MLGLAGYAMQKLRPNSGHFRVPVQYGELREQASPVVDQRSDPGQDLAALLVLCRETSRAPLIFQFVRYLLSLGPVPGTVTQSPGSLRSTV